MTLDALKIAETCSPSLRASFSELPWVIVAEKTLLALTFIDFFEQGYTITAQKLVVCLLKPDGGFKSDFFFSAFHFLWSDLVFAHVEHIGKD